MSRLDDIKKVIDAAPKVPLGELIEPVSSQVNKTGSNYPFMGVNINKQIVPTVANVSTVDPKKYIFIKHNQFVFSGMQTGRDECVRFSIYTGNTPVLLSPAYTILQVKDSTKVLPEFIFAQFLSSEKDRLGWFYSDSSVRANLDLPRFLDIRIPLPPPDVQKEYVDAYDGLQQLIRQNEALLKPLSDACQAYMAEVKSKYQEVSLGDYIEPVDVRNTDGKYDVTSLQGVTSEGCFDFSKAKTDGIDFSKYKIVKESNFAYNPSRINLGSIALRKGGDCIISPMYIVFGVKPTIEDILLPDYLFLWFMRAEFQRSTLFYASGSVRDTFSFDEMCRVRIPLPPPDVQKEYVDAYDGLQQLIRQNEALLKPLSDACQAYMAEVKSKYQEVSLGDYIEPVDVRNTDGKYDVTSLQGVTSEGCFDFSKAKTDGIDFSKYKIVKESNFAYNPSRINLGSIALRKGGDCIISPMYIVFGVKPTIEDILLPDYLFLWFMRAEFQRSTLFYASGSVRDTFSFDEMCRVRIPLPPPDVQKSIVALHKCAEQARGIAAEAKETLRKMCPAMVQRAAHDIRDNTNR